MIGIDLIDLQDPMLKDRSQSLRFIVHPKDSDKENFWYLWTAKEAVFKAQRNKQPFQPKSIHIQFFSENSFQWESLSGKVHQSTDWIVSTASDQEIEFVVFEAETKSPSNEIREKIKNWFLEEHQIETKVYADENGLPALSHNDSKISITHHGKFMAFAFFAK